MQYLNLVKKYYKNDLKWKKQEVVNQESKDKNIHSPKATEVLVKSACYSCKILDYTDYISWGIGYGPISIGGSHNTYNNKNFISPINVSFKGANDLISNIAMELNHYLVVL